MNRDYKELVGLQATFDNAVAEYHLVHYYRWQRVETKEPVQVMTGYDMERQDKVEDIIASLRKAYAPAVLTIWNSDGILSASEYLQFQPGARPDEIGLGDEWHIVVPG